MRKIKLLFNTLYVLFKSNTFFAIWLIIMQTLTTFACIFFYSTVPSATTDLASSLMSVRTISFNFNLPSNEYSFDELKAIIEKNGIAVPDSYSFTFYSEEGNTISGAANLETQASSVTEGRGITFQDVENKHRVVVAGTTHVDNFSEEITKTELKIGDKIYIDGTEFEIIGFKKNFSNYFEIPYTTGFDNFFLSTISVTLPDGLADGQIAAIQEYVSGAVNGVSVEQGLKISDITFSYLSEIIITSIFVIIIAFMNLCFIYKFIAKRMSDYFSILRIVGESSIAAALHIYLVYMAILAVSFVLGTAALMIVKNFSGLSVFENTHLNLSSILFTLAAFAVALSLLLIPSIKSVIKPIKEELLL